MDSVTICLRTPATVVIASSWRPAISWPIRRVISSNQPGSDAFAGCGAGACVMPWNAGAPFVVVVRPGLPVVPFTLFVNKARIDGDDHGRLTWGPAQAGVAAGVADALAAGTIDGGTAGELALIVAVWVDPKARDEDLVFANNRDATAGALTLGRAGLPDPADVLAARDSVWNPFFRPPA